MIVHEKNPHRGILGGFGKGRWGSLGFDLRLAGVGCREYGNTTARRVPALGANDLARSAQLIGTFMKVSSPRRFCR